MDKLETKIVELLDIGIEHAPWAAETLMGYVVAQTAVNFIALFFTSLSLMYLSWWIVKKYKHVGYRDDGYECKWIIVVVSAFVAAFIFAIAIGVFCELLPLLLHPEGYLINKVLIK